MKEFLTKMVSSTEEVSSKRVISIVGLVIFVGVVICSIFGLNISNDLIWALVSIILGAQGLTLFNKPNK